MPSKKHKPEEIIGKLREVEIVLGQGGTTAEACRRIAVSEQTYYRWRKEYGDLKTNQASNLVSAARVRAAPDIQQLGCVDRCIALRGGKAGVA